MAAEKYELPLYICITLLGAQWQHINIGLDIVILLLSQVFFLLVDMRLMQNYSVYLVDATWSYKCFLYVSLPLF